MLRVRVCGGLEIETDGRSLPDALVGGRQGRLVFAYLLCERGRSVRREELAELLWPDRLPDSWAASLSAVISRLRKLLTEAGLDGTEAITSVAGAYQLLLPEDTVIDLDELEGAVAAAEASAGAGDTAGAVAASARAEEIGARGFLADDCEWVDRQRAVVRDLRVRAALARSATQLSGGSSARAVEAAREALALDERREATYRQLMRALAAAGERAEALRVWERCRTILVEELGVDPSPQTEGVYLEVLNAGASAAPQSAAAPVTTALPSGVVTFLLTDIVDSSSLWDKAPDAMALALEIHDALVSDVVAANGGTLLKSKLEGDATVSVFARASDGAAAALALHGAMAAAPWPAGVQPRLRMAMHTGEAFERGGDYFGPALNRAARLRSLAGAGEVLLSQAITELVRDHLPPAAALRALGHRDLRGLSRGENVYALVHVADGEADADGQPLDEPGALALPDLPAALSSSEPFVGREHELATLVDLWVKAVDGAPSAGFLGGEPGVGKSRLAGEIAGHAHASGALVLYGRCDEDLGAPLQPFLEALRTLVPALGATRTGAVRGVDELARVLPELGELLPDRAPAVRADPDTERLALFDAVTNLLASASAEAPVLLVLDDLHWAGKTTLSLLRHVLRGAQGARLLVVGTYRDTELARTHPLAETLADLRRDAAATRISLSGLGAEDIDAYLVAMGIDDRALGRELAEVTSGNPFFLIEVLRHVAETGGTWSPGSLPEGVREATGRRLSRLSDITNQALSVAAVVGATFDLALVEQAQGSDLVEQVDEACRAGLIVEEPGAIGRFRFAHAIVRQVLLAELVTVKRVRLHQTIAELLEAAPVGDDPDARLADLAYHWSECASLGDGSKAVDACRRAADRAMERLAYEEAGDLYGMALQVLDANGVPAGGDPDGLAELHLARCDALLTAGDVAGSRAAIDALEGAAAGSERLAAWYTTYEGLLAVLAEPDRLTEIVQSIGAAAGAMRAIGDLRGEARAHYVHASALERLGQIGAAERALDAALAAARTADDRRLADSILAEAPPAALWGPSSVTRASGRCLDVVRVLRINDGAPAVESVALRCQAVLEALRGRADAARKMIASARRTVDRLGLAHRQLETEVAAGNIELLAGDAAEAERLLRIAYEGLRQRGLGGEAAQAGAFLGRALLLQGRVDEADEVAAAAESLAGSDLKAAIAWRGVRAECAARRGDADRALTLAYEAVDLAAATDALLLVVDARLALATVLQATGNERGAAAEAQRALEACEAKGATALAERARGGAAARPHDPATHAPAATISSSLTLTNKAVEAAIAFEDRFNRGVAADELSAHRHPDFRWEDRRHLLLDQVMQTQEGADEINAKNTEFAYRSGARFGAPKVLVTRGEHLALLRSELRGADVEFPFLVVVRVADNGQLLDYVMFDVDDRNAANVELDRLTPDELEVDNLAWRTVRQFTAATNAKDMDALLALLASDRERIEGRTGAQRPLVTERIPDSTEQYEALFALDDWAREVSLLDLHGDTRVMVHDVVWFRDGSVADAEVVSIQVYDVDDSGRIVRQGAWDPDDLDAARADLHRTEPSVGPSHTLATRAAMGAADATNAHDWEALVALIDPEVEFLDRRRVPTVPDQTQLLRVYGSLFELEDWSVRRTVLETIGDHRVMTHDVVWFRTGDVADGEVETIGVFDVDAQGRIVRLVSFAGDDLDGARAELRRGDGAAAERHENAAWQAVQRLEAAFNAQDIDRVRAILSPSFRYIDRRATLTVDLEGEEALQIFRLGVTLDEFGMTNRRVATRGHHLVLVEQTARFQDGEVGPAEITTRTVIEVDDAGRMLYHVVFDAYAVDDALAELDARAATRDGNAAWRAVQRWEAAWNPPDWEALVACFRPDVAYEDRRFAVSTIMDRDELLAMYRVPFDLDEFHQRARLVEARGEHLALVETLTTFRDGATGFSEVATLGVFEVDGAGLISRMTAFEPEAVDAARAELDARAHTAGRPSDNWAWRVSERFVELYNGSDVDALIALHAPGYSYHDRRGTITAVDLVGEEAYGQFRTAMALDEFRLERRLLDTRGDHLVLAEEHVTFRDGSTGPAQIDCLAVFEIDDDGLALRNVAFNRGAIEQATAELEARWRARSSANLAWQAALRQKAASDAVDWDAYAATFDRSFQFAERRRAMWAPPDADPLSIHRTMFDLDEWRYERTLLATRGERLALVETTCTYRTGLAGPAEVTTIAVAEANAAGLMVREAAFNPDQLVEAMAELDARSRAMRAPAGNLAWQTSLRQLAASDARAWDAFLATLHPDFVYIDVRRTLWVPTDDPLEIFRTMFSLTEWSLERTLVAARGEHLVLVDITCSFRDADAGPSVVSALGLYEVAPDGRMLRETGFEHDDLAVAMAALDRRWQELQSPTDGNLAWQSSLRMEDAATARDWDTFIATIHPDYEVVDVRRSLWVPTGDPLAMWRTMFSLDEAELRRTLLEVRGDRLALTQGTCRFRDGAAGMSEVTTLTLLEAAADGRVVRETTFDLDDREAAVAALDERWAELQELSSGAVENIASRAMRRLSGRSDELSWDEVATQLHPDHVYEDRRRSMWVPAQPGSLANWRTMFELDEWELRRQLLATRGEHLALARTRTRFRDGVSGPAEVDTIAMTEVDPNGLVIRETAFEPEDLDGAMAALEARWAELQTEPPPPEPNRAWLVAESALQAFDDRDWETFVDHFEPDWEFDDRQRGIAAGILRGDDAFAALQMGFDLDATWERRLVATAGDRLALEHDLFRGTDGAVAEFEVDTLTAIEVAADGRIRRRVAFSPDDLAAAMGELHERHRLLEDPLAVPRTLAVRAVERDGWTLVAAIGDHACLHETQDGGTVVHEVDDGGQVVAALTFTPDRRRGAFDELVVRGYRTAGLPDCARDISRAFLADDRSAVAALLADDCTVEDHRRLRPSAPQGASGYLTTLLRSGAELAPDHVYEVIRVEVPQSTSRCHLAVVRTSGTTIDGAEFESVYVAVTRWNADDLMTDLAMYEPEDIEDARAHLAALAPVRPQGGGDPLAIPRNLAVRSVAEPGWTRLSALGEHLCLHDTGDRLVLHEVDDAGEVTAFLAFSPTDRARAFDEVAVRAFARYGAPPLASGMLPAMNARDVAAFRTCMSDDCVVEDHRNLRVLPLATGDDYAESFVLYMELAATYCVEMIRIDAMEPWGVVTLNKFTGTSNDGAAFEIPCLACSTWDASGRANLLALYEAQDIAAALERLAAAGPTDQLE